MSDNRNLGITEARLGLTLLTCLLVAFGYVVLQRLGNGRESQPARTDASPLTGNIATSSAIVEPQILPVQGTQTQNQAYPRLSQRPVWLAPQPNMSPDSIGDQFEMPSRDIEAQEPNLFQPPGTGAGQLPADSMRN